MFKSLCVLDDLGSFRDLDAAGWIDAGLDDRAVDIGHLFERFGRIAGHHFDDFCERPFFVAGVDALGRIADEKILLPLEAGNALNDRDADFFGRTGIDGRFKHHDGAGLDMAANSLGTFNKRREIRVVDLVNRRRHGHDDEIGMSDDGRVCRARQVLGGAQILAAHFTGRIDKIFVSRDLLNRQVKPVRLKGLPKFNGEREPDVAQTDYGNNVRFQGPATLLGRAIDVRF